MSDPIWPPFNLCWRNTPLASGSRHWTGWIEGNLFAQESCAWKTSSCGKVTIHFLWKYPDISPTNPYSNLPLRQTMGTWAPSHKVLSFLPFLHKTWPLFCIVSLLSRRSLGAGMLMAHHWSTWEAETLICRTAFHSGVPLCGPVLQSLDHLQKIFQRIPEEHFRRIGQTSFSSQTEVPTFRREPRPLDPGIAQASSCMLVPLGWGLYLLLQTPFYSWHPSHTATALFMSRKIYYKSSPFPTSMVFKEEQKYMALTILNLCTLHAMLSLYL